MNHEWTQINTNRPEDRWTSCNDKRRQMLLQTHVRAVAISWDEAPPGARASRPHQAWHSLAHLPHLDQPATAPWLSIGVADVAPSHKVPAGSIALKLSDGQAANAAGFLQRRWTGWCSRQGLAQDHALAGTRCGRDARAPGGSLSSRGRVAERRRLMRWGGGAGPAGRGIDFFIINMDAQDAQD